MMRTLYSDNHLSDNLQELGYQFLLLRFISRTYNSVNRMELDYKPFVHPQSSSSPLQYLKVRVIVYYDNDLDIGHHHMAVAIPLSMRSDIHSITGLGIIDIRVIPYYFIYVTSEDLISQTNTKP